MTRAYSLSEVRENAAGMTASTTTPVSTQSRTRTGFGSRLTGAGRGSAVRTPTAMDVTPRSSSSVPFNGPSSADSSGRTIIRQLSDGTGGSGGGQSYRDAIAHARTQLAIAAGLVELAARNFRGAVLSFLQVN